MQFLKFLILNTSTLRKANKYYPHELKTRLMDEWVQFDQSIVDAAMDQF